MATIEIRDLTHDGRGIGVQTSGKTCFISDALPTEKVEVKLVNEKRHFSEGLAIKLLQPSNQRVEPACIHYQDCGGCSLQHMSGEGQLAWKQTHLQSNLKKSGLQAMAWSQPLASDAWRYRNRIRLAVTHSARSGENNAIQLGYRRYSSNEIIHIQHCLIASDIIEQATVELRQLLTEWCIPQIEEVELYDQQSFVVASLILKKPLSAAQKQRIESLDIAQSLFRQIWCVVDRDPSRICGDDSELSYQLPIEQCSPVLLQYIPTQFIQVNSIINQRMVQQALDWLSLKAGQRLIDMFCGIGNFSLAFARTGVSVMGLEGYAPSIQQASKNAALNGLSDITEFQVADLSDQQWHRGVNGLRPKHIDAVLLDPPRDGAAALIPWLKKVRPKKILYVSCHPATQIRDMKQLVELGYVLVNMAAMDMFPQTTHVESMAYLEYQPKPKQKTVS